MTTTLYGLVRSQAEAFPGRPALDFAGKLTTYREFHERVDRVASGFESLGIGHGDRVGICAPNCPQAIAAIYACSRIGAVAVLLNPLSPPRQLLSQLAETSCRSLVMLDILLPPLLQVLDQPPPMLDSTIHLRLQEELPSATALLYSISAFAQVRRARTAISAASSQERVRLVSWKEMESTGRRRGQATTPEPDATAPAIVVLSGGTTGEPKPVLHTSRSINYSSLQCVSLEPPFSPDMSMLVVLPFFHIFGLVVSVNIALTAGIKCILVPRFKPDAVAKMIVRQKPTYMAAVPTIYEALLQSKEMANAERAGRLDFTGFRVGFCGGDKISPDSLRLFNDLIARNGGSGRVLDGYGLSEVCPVTVMPRNGDGPTGSIGVPIPGVHLSIVEPGTTTTLPRNSEGEICVSGDALMAGYLDDEEATRKVLWRHEDGRTWLHTGDSGYMDESGYLFFKSRLRQIIKVSGNTVYLTEVQSVLSRHPAVARVAAVPKTDEKGQERVGVVIVPAGELTRQEVLAHCQELLPPWAVPVSIEFRDELPVNLLGKIAWGKL